MPRVKFEYDPLPIGGGLATDSVCMRGGIQPRTHTGGYGQPPRTISGFSIEEEEPDEWADFLKELNRVPVGGNLQRGGKPNE